MSVTMYVLNKLQSWLLLLMLTDKIGIMTHANGVNLERKKRYDISEDFILELTRDNLSLCCGPNMVFDKFEKVAILKENPKKNHVQHIETFDCYLFIY